MSAEPASQQNALDGQVEAMKIQPEQQAAANDSSTKASNSPDTTRRYAIDVGTLQKDGLVSAEEAKEYVVYRQIIEMSQRFGRYDKPLCDVVMHCFEKINVFCIYLLVPDTMSKMMKDWICVPRSLIKNLRPLNQDLSKLSEIQRAIHDDAINELNRHCQAVFSAVDGLIERVDKAYNSLEGSLFKKYELRYAMVKSSLLKINGDFKRYFSEHQEHDEKIKYAEMAKKDYEEAYKGFLSLPNGKKSPYSLSCMLNYSVLLCDVFGDVDGAIKCAQDLLKETENILEQEDFKDKCFVQLIQLFRDNVVIWRQSKHKDDSESEEDSQETPNKQISLARSKTMNIDKNSNPSHDQGPKQAGDD